MQDKRAGAKYQALRASIHSQADDLANPRNLCEHFVSWILPYYFTGILVYGSEDIAIGCFVAFNRQARISRSKGGKDFVRSLLRRGNFRWLGGR
ncbi:MAG: hypothetical protein Q7N95_16510 [Alphaproteobacteria bacterium]|nr:hypothetical protein [Alphaproteobacteria bacterium]